MDLITAGLPESMCLPTSGYRTGNPDINMENWKSEMLGHGRSLEDHNITQIYAIIIAHIPNYMNGARTLNIHQDGAEPGLNRPTSTTGGQPLIARYTRDIRGLLRRQH